MTAIDLAICAAVGIVIGLTIKYRSVLKVTGVFPGIIWINVGLLITAGFYSADLFTMFVLPQFVSMASAMVVMQYLHLNIS